MILSSHDQIMDYYSLAHRVFYLVQVLVRNENNSHLKDVKICDNSQGTQCRSCSTLLRIVLPCTHHWNFPGPGHKIWMASRDWIHQFIGADIWAKSESNLVCLSIKVAFVVTLSVSRQKRESVTLNFIILKTHVWAMKPCIWQTMKTLLLFENWYFLEMTRCLKNVCNIKLKNSDISANSDYPSPIKPLLVIYFNFTMTLANAYSGR